MYSTRKTTLYLCAVLFAVFVSTWSCVEGDKAEDDLRQFLDRKEVVFEDISVELGTAIWNLYTDEGEADQELPKKRFAELMRGDTLNTVIDYWFEKLDEMNDRNLARRVEIWHNILTGAKVNLSDSILNLQTDLETWLTEEDSTSARPSSEELESMMLDLMRLRNEKAREIGFEDYPDLMFEISELGTGWFNRFASLVDSLTLEPYEKLLEELRREKESDELAYVDVRELFRQFYRQTQGLSLEHERYETVMKETVRNIGIDYEKLPVRFVEKELPSLIGGQGFAIRIPDDFRVVMIPELPFEYRMHELGHGMQWMFCTIESPILKGYEWNFGNECPGWSEGMAETIAEFLDNAEWQKKYLGVTKENLAERTAVKNKLAPVFFRFQLTTFMYEVELYRNLDLNPRDVDAILMRKYLLVDLPIDNPGIPVANLVYVSYPVYHQYYLLADIIAWQIHETLEEQFGESYVYDSHVGDFLKKHFYEKGERVPWRTKLINATGRDLDVAGYLKSFGLF
jgi:peptidyl-dipeptidase A